MIAEPSKVLFEHIVAASHRIRGHVRLTPCDRSERLSKLVGAECFIKLENMQHTGAYKERGALNKLKSLSLAEAQKGVVAASAGNHGQAVAYHAGLMGIQASIYMPVGTATIRVSRTEDYGANVHLTGNSYEEAYKACLEHLNDGVLIHSYDDTRVIAGHGTIGLEILQQAPNIDVIVVPIGGGGLISGIALAAKEINPRVRIIGVEPHGIPSMYLTTSTGIRDIYPSVITIADCINVRQVGELTSRMCTQLVDDYVTVTDEEICRAMVFLLEGEKTVTEGAGAACVAALLTNKIANIAGKRVCALVSGGNVDVNVVSQVIELGLIDSNRRFKLSAFVSDNPGSLAILISKVSELQASVVSVVNERTSTRFGCARVTLVLDVKGREHSDFILKELQNTYPDVVSIN